MAVPEARDFIPSGAYFERGVCYKQCYGVVDVNRPLASLSLTLLGRASPLYARPQTLVQWRVGDEPAGPWHLGLLPILEPLNAQLRS